MYQIKITIITEAGLCMLHTTENENGSNGLRYLNGDVLMNLKVIEGVYPKLDSIWVHLTFSLPPKSLKGTQDYL